MEAKGSGVWMGVRDVVEKFLAWWMMTKFGIYGQEHIDGLFLYPFE
jgi:hypothetical protein